MALVMLSWQFFLQGTMVKGLLGATLGMAFALPGIDSSIGQARLTFGSDALLAGFGLLPVLIGAFAISQILRDFTLQKWEIWNYPSGACPSFGQIFDMVFVYFVDLWPGTWIGLLPGIGGNIAPCKLFNREQIASDPEVFGTGHEPGVIAAESANNASIGGALIPLITMGIPGSVTEAILIGALTIHNLQPGPHFLQNAPEIAYGIIAAYLVANIIMLILMWNLGAIHRSDCTVAAFRANGRYSSILCYGLLRY